MRCELFPPGVEAELRWHRPSLAGLLNCRRRCRFGCPHRGTVDGAWTCRRRHWTAASSGYEAWIAFLRRTIDHDTMVLPGFHSRAVEPSLTLTSRVPCFRQHITSAAKYVIISNNCPPLRKSEILYYAMLAKTNVHHYTGGNSNLGTACGKYFRCSTLSILDAGDSDIIRAMPAE